MHGRHLKRRGQWWHYYRHRPDRYADIEPRSRISFSLRTNCISEAKLRAAEISRELDIQWEQALARGVSLSSQNAARAYSAAIATNRAHGFAMSPTHQLSNSDLLERLRFVIEGHSPSLENKAVLGFADKPKLSMMDALERFWAHIEDEWTGLSHDQKRGKRNVYLKSIRHFIETVGDVALYDLQRSHALEFRSWWMQRKKANGLKSCTANRELDSVRRIIRVNHEIDSYEEKNPYERVRLKKEVKARRSPVPTEVIERRILGPGQLDGLHRDFQLLVQLVINTGMRPIEAIGLKLDEFKLDHEIPYVHVQKNSVRTLKTPHSERLIPLLGVSHKAAIEIVEKGGWGKRLGKNMYATSIINRHFKAKQVFTEEKQSFYSLRHWFQDQLTRRGVVDRVQCQLMGHKFNRPTYGDGAPLERLRDIIAKFAIEYFLWRKCSLRC